VLSGTGCSFPDIHLLALAAGDVLPVSDSHALGRCHPGRRAFSIQVGSRRHTVSRTSREVDVQLRSLMADASMMQTPAGQASAAPSDGQVGELCLMQRVQAGEPAALDEVLKSYWPLLVAYADRFLHDPDAAEDLVQEVFLRFWERRGEWTASERLSSFLYRITRNLALNECRRLRIRLRWLERRRRDETPRVITPIHDLEFTELGIAVEKAIEALPPRRREVFVLARLHDLSYSEIAEVMGISPQTVANQMSAALADLRQSLKPFVDGPSPATSTLLSLRA
jgi:RNA polymerase sigma-70 factor, ECF subfamily